MFSNGLLSFLEKDNQLRHTISAATHPIPKPETVRTQLECHGQSWARDNSVATI